jgi:hypothetical protein
MLKMESVLVWGSLQPVLRTSGAFINFLCNTNGKNILPLSPGLGQGSSLPCDAKIEKFDTKTKF